MKIVLRQSAEKGIWGTCGKKEKSFPKVKSILAVAEGIVYFAELLDLEPKVTKKPKEIIIDFGDDSPLPTGSSDTDIGGNTRNDNLTDTYEVLEALGVKWY
jgi:hypothetical protein